MADSEFNETNYSQVLDSLENICEGAKGNGRNPVTVLKQMIDLVSDPEKKQNFKKYAFEIAKMDLEKIVWTAPEMRYVVLDLLWKQTEGYINLNNDFMKTLKEEDREIIKLYTMMDDENLPTIESLKENPYLI